MIASAKDYIAKNDRPAATIQLKNALQKDANLGEARYLLGKIYLEQGDYPGAEKELTRAFEAGYAPDQVVPLLAQTLVQSGQGDKLATQFASTNLTQPEARAAFKTYEGLAALSKGKRDEAVAAFNEALKESPGFPLARIAQARLQAMGHDVEVDPSAFATHMRFAGDDATRLAAIHRAAASGARAAGRWPYQPNTRCLA